MLAVRGFQIPRTHDLDLLTRLVASGPDAVPNELRDAKTLSPWAVATRYDDINATLDRGAAVEIAEKSVVWARRRVEALRDGGRDRDSLVLAGGSVAWPPTPDSRRPRRRFAGLIFVDGTLPPP